jgi:GDP-L-fucose synthase
MHEAKVQGRREVVIWGTGSARREFLHVDDCADALMHILKHYSEDEHINVGCGEDLTILELAKLIAQVVGFQGQIAHDLSKPDGTPRKLMDGRKLKKLGWHPGIDLEEGIGATYNWFLAQELEG